MSDLGLYSGWYAQLREYSELVDQVLLAGLGNLEPHTETSRKRLAKLFRSLVGKVDTDPTLASLRIWMSRHIRLSPSQWQMLSEALIHGSSDNAIVQQLEEVARKLDLYRAQVFYDLRGR